MAGQGSEPLERGFRATHGSQATVWIGLMLKVLNCDISTIMLSLLTYRVCSRDFMSAMSNTVTMTGKDKRRGSSIVSPHQLQFKTFCPSVRFKTVVRTSSYHERLCSTLKKYTWTFPAQQCPIYKSRSENKHKTTGCPRVRSNSCHKSSYSHL